MKRRTIRKRMRGKLQQIKQQLRERMHDPVPQTGEWLKSAVQGYFNYHAVPGNLDRLKAFRTRVPRLWRRTLLARSQKHRLTATRMYSLETRWLAQPRVLHPYPERQRERGPHESFSLVSPYSSVSKPRGDSPVKMGKESWYLGVNATQDLHCFSVGG